MPKTKFKKTKSSDVEAAVLKCGGKVSKGKKSTNKIKSRNLANGGEVIFDLNSLSPEEKIKYQNLTSDQQTEYIKNYTSNQGSTSTLGNAGIIGSLISTAGSIFDTAAGETDEAGQSDTQVQAALQGIANSSSGANIATGIEQLGEAEDLEDYALSALNVLSPGAGELVNQQKSKDEFEREKKKSSLSNAFYSKRATTSFQNGGKVNDTDINKIIGLESKGVDVKKQDLDIIPPEGYKEVPYGTNPETKELLTRIIKESEKSQSKITPRIKRTQTIPETKFIAENVYGISAEEFNQKYNEDPKFLNELIKNERQQINENNPYGLSNQDEYSVTTNSLGNVVFSRDVIDQRKTQGLNEGGKIEGPGTGKSDSISAELPIGSYIIPADAPKSAVNRLMKYMNYDEADINYNEGEPVNVSDGEIFIPPQDVEKANAFIQRLGYDKGLDEMAPNASTKLTDNPNYANGGQIRDFLTENAGTIGGAAQLILAGIEAGKNEEPKSNTEQLLKDLSNEVRGRAAYGLNPYERTEAENAINRNLANERTIIQNVGGGSLDVIMNNVAAATTRANR
jgi:hypothetical protein